MSLSARARDILTYLLDDKINATTVAAIAEQFHISGRTVQRAMPEVTQWLDKHEITLEAKSGTGLLLHADAAQRQRARDALSNPPRIQENRQERRKQILLELLSSHEPIKSAWFCSQFGISAGTLSTDLDAVAQWAQPYGLTLSRKAGSGIALTGSESALRSAIVAVIDSKALLQWMRGAKTPESRIALPPSLPPEQAAQLQRIISDAETQLGITLADSGFSSLSVHLSLAIKRLMEGERIVMPPDRLARLRLLPEYATAEAIADALHTTFGVPIPAGEIGFITMHLAGSSVRTRAGRDCTQMDALDIHRMARDMTHIVESHLGVSFDGNESLLDGLCTHLEPLIHRLQLNMHIENSECADIQSNYPELYHATEASCAILCRELDVPSVPETEIAFLAAHFGAAIEALHDKMQRVSAVVVCPTGIGTSRLLATALSRAFPKLELHGTRSAFHLDIEEMKREGIDLIISTVDLDIKYEFICISPLLSEHDKTLLQKVIDTIARKKKTQAPAMYAAAPLGRQQVAYISKLGNELFELVDHLTVSPEYIAHTRDELIDMAGRLFAQDDVSADIIAQLFRARDSVGDTYIKPFRALLLHCRTECTDHCRLGYLRLDLPFYERGKPVQGAVVMLIPQTEHAICQPLMSEVSALLLDHDDLLHSMRRGDVMTLASALSAHLLTYYRRTVCRMLDIGHTLR